MRWLTGRWLTGASIAIMCAAVAAPATQYSVDSGQSTLEFTATLWDAPVAGRFKEFRADIRFADDDLAHSSVDLTVAMKSIDSGESDRDATARGPTLFDADRFPDGRFVSTGFTRVGANSYEATGKLTLRDATREIRVPFTAEKGATGGTGWLKGGFSFKRLDYGIGEGDMKSTDDLGNEIKLKFALRLAPAR